MTNITNTNKLGLHSIRSETGDRTVRMIVASLILFPALFKVRGAFSASGYF